MAVLVAKPAPFFHDTDKKFSAVLGNGSIVMISTSKPHQQANTLLCSSTHWTSLLCVHLS